VRAQRSVGAGSEFAPTNPIGNAVAARRYPLMKNEGCDTHGKALARLSLLMQTAI
jgi:hypothetical protein